MAKRRYSSVSVTADVDVDEFLSQLDEDELVEALNAKRSRRRGGSSSPQEFSLELLRSAYDALKSGDLDHTALLLERMLWPKWATPEDSEKAYAQRGGAAT